MSSRQDNQIGVDTSPTHVFVKDLAQMHLQEVEQIDSWATSYRKQRVSKPGLKV